MRHWTLQRKIQLLIVSIFVTLYLALQVVNYQEVYETTANQVEDDIFNYSLFIQDNMDKVFSQVNASLEYIDTSLAGGPREDDRIRTMLQQVQATNNRLLQVYLTFENQEYINVPALPVPDSVDLTQRDWYLGAQAVQGVYWTTPYVDIITENLVVTASREVVFSDTSGVLGFDINLSHIEDLLDGVILPYGGDLYLVNEKGQVLAGNQANNSEDLSYFFDQIQKTSLDSQDVIKTEIGYYYINKLGQSDLLILGFIPISVFQNLVKDWLIQDAILLAGVFLLAMLVSNAIIKRLIHPLNALAETMKISQEEGTLIPFFGRSSRDIESVIEAYNQLVTHVSSQQKEITQVSENLQASEKELQKQYNQVAKMAYTDALTALPNRAKYENEIRYLLDQEKNFAVVYMDLDNFKYINDSYGHDYGDQVLEILSQRFKKTGEDLRLSARLSGDEFGFVITGYKDLNALLKVVKQLFHQVSQVIKMKQLEVTLEASVGISRYPQDGDTFELLLSHADIAMYEAKKQNKNSYVLFDQELKAKAIGKMNLEAKLTHAIEYNEMMAYYQPLLSVETGQVVGFEALIRWHNDDLGPVYPDEFIPLAERNGYIHQIGQFVLSDALAFGQALYHKTGKRYEMNVNVSVMQLRNDNFVPWVLDSLAHFDWPNSYLNIEITESLEIENNSDLLDKLAYLRDQKVHISLDDFGSGYSSLNHILKLSLSHIKIDRMLIVEASKDNQIFELMKGIVEFAHVVDLKVVAEGIEDAFMERMMREMKADFVQGYKYAKPLPKEQVEVFLLDEKDPL